MQFSCDNWSTMSTNEWIQVNFLIVTCVIFTEKRNRTFSVGSSTLTSQYIINHLFLFGKGWEREMTYPPTVISELLEFFFFSLNEFLCDLICYKSHFGVRKTESGQVEASGISLHPLFNPRDFHEGKKNPNCFPL